VEIREGPDGGSRFREGTYKRREEKNSQRVFSIKQRDTRLRLRRGMSENREDRREGTM